MGKEEFGRGEFLARSRNLALALYTDPLGRGVDMVYTPERQERPTIVLQKHGFHGIPERGGGLRVDEQIARAVEVGSSSLLILSPEPQDGVVTAAHKAGQLIIARGSNEYNPKQINGMLASYPDSAQKIIQVGNELNLDYETVYGKQVIEKNMRDYVYGHFMPAARHVTEAGGTILIPPTAQTFPTHKELFYKASFLNHLKAHPDFTRIQENLADCAHAYIVTPGANEQIFKRIEAVHNATKRILQMNLPLYITEAGIQHRPDTIGVYPPELISREIKRLLLTPLPEGMDIRSINWWLLANSGFRSEQILPEHELWMKVYDESAWIKDGDTLTPWYTDTVKLLEERSKHPPTSIPY